MELEENVEETNSTKSRVVREANPDFEAVAELFATAGIIYGDEVLPSIPYDPSRIRKTHRLFEPVTP